MTTPLIQYNKLPDSLSLFPNLQRITASGSLDRFVDFTEKIVNNSPTTLKSIIYATASGSTAPIRQVGLNLIVPAPNIESLEVDILVMNGDNSLLYIMKKYPNLKSLKINHWSDMILYSEEDFFGSMNSTQSRFSVPAIAKFLIYALRIPHHDVKYLYTNKTVLEILERYWLLCDPKVPKSIVLQWWTQSGRHVEERNRPSVHIGVGSDVYMLEKAPKFSFVSFAGSPALPLDHILEQRGGQIDKLGLIVEYSKNRRLATKQEAAMVKGGYLVHLLTHCTRLSHLVIEDSCLYDFVMCPQASPVHSNITTLCLVDVELYGSVLEAISRKIPSLKTILLQDCKFMYINDDIPTERSITINMPETSLESMTITLPYGVEVDHEYIEKGIQIKLSTRAGTSYYCGCSNSDMNIEKRQQKEYDSLENIQYLDAKKSDVCSFDEAIVDPDCGTFDIRCKTIGSLKVALSHIKPAYSCKIKLEQEDVMDERMFVHATLCQYNVSGANHAH